MNITFLYIAIHQLILFQNSFDGPIQIVDYSSFGSYLDYGLNISSIAFPQSFIDGSSVAFVRASPQVVSNSTQYPILFISQKGFEFICQYKNDSNNTSVSLHPFTATETLSSLGVYFAIIILSIYCLFSVYYELYGTLSHAKKQYNHLSKKEIEYFNIYKYGIYKKLLKKQCLLTNEKLVLSPLCSICLNKYKLSDTIRLLYCHHIFHKDCIDTWLLIHNTCPICRKEY
ncbi:hypothetical protein WA158_005335 [Blastocystis sp. Blastoise]